MNITDLNEFLHFTPILVMLLGFTGILTLVVYALIEGRKNAKMRAESEDWSFDDEEYLKRL